MAIQYSFKNINQFSCGGSNNTCKDVFGCPPDKCPDFVIRRHDTKPPFKVKLEDCDGPLDIQGLVVEVNMWAVAHLKKSISNDCEYFALAGNIGFEQIMVGDIIAMDRVRSPEYMLVIGFDECNKLVRVQRGYRSSTPDHWKKGSKLRIFRILNAPAQTEMVFEDIEHVDGTIESDTLTNALLVYEWTPEDVCLPGCFWLEFKILKMKNVVFYLPGGFWTGNTHQVNETYYTGSIQTDSSVPLSYDAVNDRYFIGSNAWQGDINIDSNIYYTGSTLNDGSVILDKLDKPVDETVGISMVSNTISTGIVELTDNSSSIPTTVPVCTESPASCVMSFTDPNLDFGCLINDDIEWMRRFPLQGEGFLVKIENSATKDF